MVREREERARESAMLRRASEALKPSPSDIELDERASRTLDEMERRDEFSARAVVRRESDRIAKKAKREEATRDLAWRGIHDLSKVR